ncbi:MAG: hypothetical protein WDW36_007069 [Sanguina aurantia]
MVVAVSQRRHRVTPRAGRPGSVGYNPGPQWLPIFLSAAHRQINRFFPHTLSTLLHCLAAFAPGPAPVSSSGPTGHPNAAALPSSVGRAGDARAVHQDVSSSSSSSRGMLDDATPAPLGSREPAGRSDDGGLEVEGVVGGGGGPAGLTHQRRRVQPSHLAPPPHRPPPTPPPQRPATAPSLSLSQPPGPPPPPPPPPPDPIPHPPPALPRHPTAPPPPWVPPGFLAAAAAQLQRTLPSHSPAQMVTCLAALVRLGYSPHEQAGEGVGVDGGVGGDGGGGGGGGGGGFCAGAELVCGLLEETRSESRGGRLGQFSRGECAVLLQVLAAWDVRPGAVWLSDVETASGVHSPTPDAEPR